DLHLTRARAHENARRSRLAAPGSIKIDLAHCALLSSTWGILRGLDDIERLRLLRLVRMVRSGVDLELAGQLTAQLALRQHAAHRLFDQLGGTALAHLAGGRRLQATRIAGVAVIHLLLLLAP